MTGISLHLLKATESHWTEHILKTLKVLVKLVVTKRDEGTRGDRCMCLFVYTHSGSWYHIFPQTHCISQKSKKRLKLLLED